MRVTGTDSLAEIAAENGIDVVRIKNVLDPGPGVNLPQYAHVATTPADTYVAMNPDNNLSKFKTVILTARIAKSGDIKGAAGDLEGSLTAVKVGADKVRLVIDTERK